MTLRSVTAVYFSPTGTTKKTVIKTADSIGRILGLPVEHISITSPGARADILSFFDDTLVVFGVPVYAGRVPNVLLKFLQNSVRGKGAPAVPIVMFGNRNFDDGLIELRDILEVDGFHTVAAGAFVGEHAFSYTLGKGRPDENDLELAESLARLVCRRLESQEFISPVPVSGSCPIRPYCTPRDRNGTPINILKVKPKTSFACTLCKKCVWLCPMGAIDEDCVSVPGVCIKCGACVKSCPQHAKYFDDRGYVYHRHELEEIYASPAESVIF